MKLALKHIQLLAATALFGTIAAQSTSNSTSASASASESPFVVVQPPGFGVDENGVANISSTRTNVQPLVCVDGCRVPIALYRICVYNETLPIGDILTGDQDQCDDWLCDREGYAQLHACLECVISNGNERPYGYEQNSSLTAVPTGASQVVMDPSGGYLNETLANEWLANVVDRCSAADMALEDVTTTVTATPTATGPYETSITLSQTVSQAVWTGLTEYSDRFTPTGSLPWEAALETIVSNFNAGSTGGQFNPSSAGAPASSSAEAEATSSPNAGAATVPMGSYGWCFAALGLLWI